jgi:hypothetical protein
MNSTKIYVAVFNYYGDYRELAARYTSATLINGDTLCFENITGPEISRLMEKDGCDYNYSYEAPEAAWRKDD